MSRHAQPHSMALLVFLAAAAIAIYGFTLPGFLAGIS